MSGREIPIVWNGRRVQAWVPDPLGARDLTLSVATARRTEQAVAGARHSDGVMADRFETLTRLLLRAEGRASSFIEGVHAPLADVAAAELAIDMSDAATLVADNLHAVRAAIAGAHEHELDVATLHRWHSTLMAHERHIPRHLVGAVRDAQGWIGGTSPLDAALMTPPPAYIAELLDDLVLYANRTDIDAVTQAAVAHAQFETIHPYGDGNGRIGRVLIGWILTRRLHLASPPPVSVRIALDRIAYLSGLTLFRLGSVDPWVRWFADIVTTASQATVDLIGAIAELESTWIARLASVRSDAAARNTVPLLAAYPVLNAATIARELDVSERSARTALNTLQQFAIIEPYEPYEPARRPTGRPQRRWIAPELISLVTNWSN